MSKSCKRVKSPPLIVTPASDEQLPNFRVGDDHLVEIYIVWTVGLYPNGVEHLDIRAITTSMGKAKLFSKMLRRDKEFCGEDWRRVIIEPRVANHLYGRKYREMDINTGRM